ncbi:MAG: hypothetical protein JSV76_00475 [Candidatus Bathyarchaeota archaeon]|nr:MAG: hypothetical protein JSV76_00475 [Candidatus Bathyarchaeota archaeon]
MGKKLGVEIIRTAEVITFPFTDYFKGFERVQAVQHLFGEATKAVLNDLRVEFRSGRGYMGVSDEDGHLSIRVNYLKNGDEMDIYLDIIHELVHVKQFLEGKKLREGNFSYVDRPTEIEAYRHSVIEAKRLGLDEQRILEYLKTERMSDEDLRRLANAVNIRIKRN